MRGFRFAGPEVKLIARAADDLFARVTRQFQEFLVDFAINAIFHTADRNRVKVGVEDLAQAVLAFVAALFSLLDTRDVARDGYHRSLPAELDRNRRSHDRHD